MDRADNPWLQLPDAAPYVLPNDQPILEAFHRNQNPKLRYRLDLPPDPWQGKWTAPVLLLLQNPSLGGADEGTYADPGVLAANRANLDEQAGELPMYWLDDRLAHTYSGMWWRRCLNRLVKEVGLSVVRQNLLVVELYGYRSPSFWPLSTTLPSQTFSLELVASAIERNATIVLPRASRYWEVALPKLYGYDGLVRGKPGVRGAHVSAGNLELGGYERVVDAIRGSG